MDQQTREFFGLTEGTDRMIVTIDGRRAKYRIERILLMGGRIVGLRLTDQNDRLMAVPWSAVAHIELPQPSRSR